jgi:hypothetical protein
MASYALPRAQALADPLRLHQKLPVVGPRGVRDSHRDLRLEMLASGSHCVLLRAAPPIPRGLTQNPYFIWRSRGDPARDVIYRLS